MLSQFEGNKNNEKRKIDKYLGEVIKFLKGKVNT
jgi:hypothetical protein